MDRSTSAARGCGPYLCLGVQYMGYGPCSSPSTSTSAVKGRGRPATASPSTSAARGRGQRATTPRVVTSLEILTPIPDASPQPEVPPLILDASPQSKIPSPMVDS